MQFRWPADAATSSATPQRRCSTTSPDHRHRRRRAVTSASLPARRPHAAKTTSGGFVPHARGSLLGDIVNSNPAYVGAAERDVRPSVNYAHVPERRTSRTARRWSTSARTTACCTASTRRPATSRSPTFRARRSRISTSSRARSYVAPLLTSTARRKSADAQSATAAWSTVLVGGLGGGGQGLYALDVSNPAHFSETATPPSPCCGSSTTPTTPTSGFVYGKPVDPQDGERHAGRRSSRAATTTPKATRPTGTGDAFLFIIFLDGPTGAEPHVGARHRLHQDRHGRRFAAGHQRRTGSRRLSPPTPTPTAG